MKKENVTNKSKNNIKESLNNTDSKTNAKKNKKHNFSIKLHDNSINTNVSFNLIEVIIIILITGIIVSIISAIIVFNNYYKLDNEYAQTITKDEMDKFEDNYNKIINKYVEEVNRDELIEAAIKGMYNYLGDDYSVYISKDDTIVLEEQLNGEYRGIGIEITSSYTSDGIVSKITKVFKDSPAEKVGLKVGDVLVSLNDVLLSEKEASYVSNTIKYSENEENILKVNRNGKEIEFTVKRDLVYIDYVQSKVFENKIGYIKIDSFGSTTAKQVKEAIDKFDKSINSIIIDVRDNNGGYLDSADEIANIFIEKGKNIYQMKNRDGKITIYKAKRDIYRKFDNIAVLVNENSASASEVLALALKESANAVIVGNKSFGKGTVQETEILDSGSMVKYTIAYWLSPNGNSINEVGIEPDVKVEDSTKQLNKAKEVLKK